MPRVQRLLPDQDVPDIHAYQDMGGGRGFEVALRLEPHEVIDLIELSGLRGRGGAGFPTGRKWRTIVAHCSPVEPTPVVVNAAEGEPGTFKDRMLMRRNPFLVLEGALVAARAIGSTSVIVALKSSFATEAARMEQAIAEMRDIGWLDGLRIRVVSGPTEYLFGEETGLLEVLEGRPPFPRITPPWRRGLDRVDEWNSAADADLAAEDGGAVAPVLVDNVETLANLPLILGEGVEWFRSIGTEASPGSMLCTVTGACNRHGVGEFAFGTPLSEVLDDIGGGPRLQRTWVAALSGVAAPPLPADRFDTPLTYEDMAEAGSGLGSASFIVIDDAVPLRQVAADVARFLSVESCGQCEPCKRDGLAIAVELRDGSPPDHAVLADRLATVNEGARCALADQTKLAVGGLWRMAPAQVVAAGETDDDRGAPGDAALGAEADIGDEEVTTDGIDPSDLVAIVPLLDIVDGLAVLDLTHRTKGPDWTTGDITDQTQWPAARLGDPALRTTTSP